MSDDVKRDTAPAISRDHQLFALIDDWTVEQLLSAIGLMVTMVSVRVEARERARRAEPHDGSGRIGAIRVGTKTGTLENAETVTS